MNLMSLLKFTVKNQIERYSLRMKECHVVVMKYSISKVLEVGFASILNVLTVMRNGMLVRFHLKELDNNG